MKIENGNLVLEMERCSTCNGVGTVQRIERCPRWEMPQKGKACPHCGAKRKSSHGYLTYPDRIKCSMCAGSGEVLEWSGKRIPAEIFDEWFQGVEWTLNVEDRKVQSFNEAYIGLGMEYCCTDYGRAYNAYKGKTCSDADFVRFLLRNELSAKCPKKLHITIYAMGVTVREII